MCVQALQESVPLGRSSWREIVAKMAGTALSMSLHTVAIWILRSAQRRALRELALEGRLLGDVGLTCEQALREAARPFWRG